MSDGLAEALRLATAVNFDKPLVIENFINGRFVSSTGGEFVDSFHPATGRVWARVPSSGAVEVGSAVEAAQQAFKTWSKRAPEQRSRVLTAIADEVERNVEAFACAESMDQGKPVGLARTVDIPRCVHNFRFFASAVLHQTNECRLQHVPCAALNYVTQQPLGVAALITPWNLPLYLLSFKLAPALAAGCTVVAKPSEFTSVTAWLLAKVFVKVGVPAGVVNFVLGTGAGAGSALVTHPLVAAVSFTGSTATGRLIASQCAPSGKRVSLEMGGKNACIVFADADLQQALPVIARSCFANQGEICLCTSRLFVHKDIIETFVKQLVRIVSDIKVGDPASADTTMGALVSSEHLAKVRSFIELAKSEGATFDCGLEPLDLPEHLQTGYYLRPVVLTGVGESSRLMTEEIFGPVVCVEPFSDTSAVIGRANAVDYGLSASVWSTDLDTVHHVAQSLDVGTVWCNCWLVRDLHMPFGGMKASGCGREDYRESLEFYSEKKTICIKMQQP